jgi:hypothetical protein
MTGKTAACTVSRLNEYIHSLDDDDSCSINFLSFEIASVTNAHDGNSIIKSFNHSMKHMSGILARGSVMMSELPINAWLSSTKALLMFADQKRAFCGQRENITDAQRALLAGAVNSLLLHQQRIPKGLGNRRIVVNSRNLFKPSMFRLNIRQSMAQLWRQVTIHLLFFSFLQYFSAKPNSSLLFN